MNYNEDELNIPDWMDRKFFYNVMTFNKADKLLQILDFVIEPATAKGEHWSSVMYRVRLNYEINQFIKCKSIIVKIMPESDGCKKDICGKSFIFDTEIDIYSKILPKFMAIQKKNQKCEPITFGPQILYYTRKPRYIIVLEDLKELDYSVLKNRMCNYTEAELAIQKLAKWHALSYKMHKEDKTVFTNLSHSIFEFWDWYNNESIRDCFQHFVKLLNRIPNFQGYAKRIDEWHDDFIEKCGQSYQNSNQSSEFAVLCHGDLHIKNIMQSTDKNGILKDILFVDYQMCAYTTVAIDLYYFLYCTMDLETRLEHRDDLIKFYFKCFVKNLDDLEFNGQYPTEELLQLELLKHRHLEVFLLGISVPFLYAMAFNDIELNIEDILQNNNVRGAFYNNPRYIKVVSKLMPIFDQKGYFL